MAEGSERQGGRRHQYITVVSNPETGHVLHVAPGRGKDVLMAFYEGIGEKCRAAVESVSMDMWGPYISATLAMIPDAVMKIAFDRFHVARHLGGLDLYPDGLPA